MYVLEECILFDFMGVILRVIFNLEALRGLSEASHSSG